MTHATRAPAWAVLAFILCPAPLLASSAMVSQDLVVREGPGEEYKNVWTLFAGMRVDVRECKPTNWCFVVADDGKEGWIHARFEVPGTDSADPGDGDVADDSDGSDKGTSTKRRRTAGSGDTGDSGTTDESSGDGKTTKRERHSYSSGGTESSGQGESAATEAAPAGGSTPGCRTC